MTSSSNKTLLFIIAILVIANLALLAYFFWPRDKKSHGGRESSKPDMVSYSLEKSVGFDDQQMTKYSEIKKSHKEKIKPLFDSLRISRENFYKLLQQQDADSSLQISVQTIGARQEAIDVQIYNHFKEIRAICRPEQYPAFDSMVQKAVMKMSAPYKKKSDKK